MKDERSFTTTHGMNWDWLSSKGERQGLQIQRMVTVKGRGVVLGISPYGDPDKVPRIQVFLSEGGRSLRVWKDGVEL